MDLVRSNRSLERTVHSDEGIFPLDYMLAARLARQDVHQFINNQEGGFDIT